MSDSPQLGDLASLVQRERRARIRLCQLLARLARHLSDATERTAGVQHIHREARRMAECPDGEWSAAPPAAHAACDEGGEADRKLPLQVSFERDHLSERMRQFREDYRSASGISLGRQEAVRLLLDWALGHVNLIESLIEEGEAP